MFFFRVSPELARTKIERSFWKTINKQDRLSLKQTMSISFDNYTAEKYYGLTVEEDKEDGGDEEFVLAHIASEQSSNGEKWWFMSWLDARNDYSHSDNQWVLENWPRSSPSWNELTPVDLKNWKNDGVCIDHYNHLCDMWEMEPDMVAWEIEGRLNESGVYDGCVMMEEVKFTENHESFLIGHMLGGLGKVFIPDHLWKGRFPTDINDTNYVLAYCVCRWYASSYAASGVGWKAEEMKDGVGGWEGKYWINHLDME
jgi:hypothetical protein